MAIRAPNLTLCDLGVDGCKARAGPSEARDGRALGPDVVELEKKRVRFATVHARVRREDSEDMSEVARDERIRVGTPRRHGDICASPTGSSRRASPVAVGADHLAAGHFRVDCRDRGRGGEQRWDVRRLLRHVVELEHDGIGFAALDARVFTQVIQDMGAEPPLTCTLGGARLAAMHVASGAEVGREAGSAPPLNAIAKAVEALQRKVVTASAATTDLPWPPHEQAPRRESVDRARETIGRRAHDGTKVSHPYAHRRLRHAELAGNPRERPAQLCSQSSRFALGFALSFHEHMFASGADVLGI
jgi:hypothetical protein